VEAGDSKKEKLIWGWHLFFTRDDWADLTARASAQ